MSESAYLKRSEEFDENIAKVRIMETSSSIKISEKKQAAKELRMNFYLDNAKLMSGATAALMEDPKMAEAEMIHYLQKFYVITRPQLAQTFVYEMIDSKNHVLNALEVIKEESNNQDDNLAQILYKGLVSNINVSNPAQFPMGKVRFGKKYPLALVLEIENKEDYQILYGDRKGSGGYFSSEALFWGKEKGVYFPLIVVNGYGKDVVGHERVHAENNVIFSSLRFNFEAKSKWGWESVSYPEKDLKFVKDQFYKSTEKSIKIRKSNEWGRIMSWALSKAKDEVLAEMDPINGEIDWQLNNLKSEDGIYNYFEMIGISMDSDLGRIFWKDYTDKLSKTTRAVRELNYFYQDRNWKNRSGLLRWVASQLPIEKWEERFRSDGYFDEQETYQKIDGDFMYVINQIKFLSLRNRYDLSVLSSETNNLKERFTFTVKNESDRCLLRDFKEIDTKLGLLMKKIVDIDEDSH